MINIDLTKKVSERVYTQDLPRLLNKTIKVTNLQVDKSKKGLNLIFVDDKEIQMLNRQYRQKNKPTDVLSFSYMNDLDNDVLGEIIISVDTLKRQAKAYKITTKQETQLLFVHGLLHILGFDHEKEVDKVEMKSLEQKVLGDKVSLISRVDHE